MLEEGIYSDLKRKVLIEELCQSVGKMSTYRIGCLVNYLVGNMSQDTCYLNIGVWKGFTLFSGMVGNPDKVCIGVDNFSEFGGPRDVFLPKFNELKSGNHEFYEMDFRKYFEEHTRKIGVYYYDALHNFEAQYIGLTIAESYFSQDCYILVDDWNWDFVRDATNRFLSERKDYKIVLERRTTTSATDHSITPTGEPTDFWNGLLVVKKS